MALPLYLLYLDRYHQGDRLFLERLAQSFARLTPGQLPALIVHGGGEKLERTLEADGLFPERREGVVQTETPRQAALAERAVREANQELAALFADHAVAAVGLQGADRGLLRRTSDGAVQTPSVGWVEDLVKMHVVPVVSVLAKGAEGRAEEVSAAHAIAALAEGLAAFEVTLCFLTKGGRRPDGPLGVEDLPEAMLPEPETVRRAATQSRADLLLTDADGFFAGGGPQGTRVERS